jgi:hypothetical protein
MKIIELYIQEEDESGVSALSFVNQPANHFEWLVFNSEECNGTCSLKKDIKTKGESFASYIDMGVQFRVEDLTEEEYHKFYSPFSTANQSSREDSGKELVRYYYAIEPGRGAILKRDSRSICRDFIFAGLVYRDEDLQAMSSQLSSIDANRRLIPRTQGYNVDLKNWKAGKQCNHIFRKLIFTVPDGMTPEQFASTLPTRAGQAFGIASRNEVQPDLPARISNRTGYLEGIPGFSSQESPIGFVEGLIIYPTFQSMMKAEKGLGWTLLEINGVQGWISGAAEQDFFESEEVKVVKAGVMKEEFYNDYPEGAKEAAAMGIKRNEENDNKCATQVGKVRAQQIAKGENLSLETLKRTYSYLSRAEDGFVKAQNEKDYDSCSYISYMLWGGLDMLRWVERKLDQIEYDFMGNTGCIGTLITDGVGELEAIYRCSKDPRAHLESPHYDPTDGGEYSEHEEENDQEMVDGIIELIVSVEDMEQRKLVAEQAIETLTEEGVSFDLMDFIRRVGLEGQMQFSRHTFKDELKYEITTVVMEPDRYIVRKDPYTNEIYYVVFSKETVKLMSQKFFKQNRHKSFNVEHSDLTLNGGYVFESWLVQNPDTDKAAELGFRVNPGTWMVSLKWDNKEEFDKYVLSQETLGISLEGTFLSRDFQRVKQEYSITGEMDGEPIYSTEEEALRRAEEIGCSGTHKHGDGWMACSSHPILQGVKTSLYKDEYDIFIEEVKSIINNK